MDSAEAEMYPINSLEFKFINELLQVNCTAPFFIKAL